MQKSGIKFTIGADPELFLQNTQGKLISAVGLIGGTKEAPKPISKDGHCIQEDNVSVEFNIPPCNSADAFVKHMNFVLTHLQGRATELGLSFSNIAAASFPEDQLQTPEAQVFGCEPDFNAYTGCANEKPFSKDMNLRSCGGHVHVGTKLDRRSVIKAMDVFLGLPSLSLDKDSLRRELYGKAGAYRPKEYGVEYRSLSNFWIWSDDLKIWVFNQTQKALDFVESGATIHKDLAHLIPQAINTGNVEMAEALLQEFQ